MTDQDNLPKALIPEDSILAMMMRDAGTFLTRAKGDGLLPEMFYRPENRTIYKTLLERQDKGQDCDIRSVIYALEKSKRYEAAGGDSRFDLLLSVANAPVTPSQFAEHLSEVKDTYARRKALIRAYEAQETAISGQNAQEVVETLKNAIEEINLATARKLAFTTIAKALNLAQIEMQDRLKNGDLPGTPTGIHELDLIGGGMRSGEFWVIGGKTSAGKSALSYQILNPCLDAGGKVLIFTLEMSVSEVATRLLSCRGKIPMKALTNPQNAGKDGAGLNKGQLIKIKQSADNLREKQLFISDQPGMSMDYIIAQSEAEAELGNVDAIVVDYVQLIQGTRLHGENREQELSRYSKELKQLAKKLKCVVISPVQLNDDGRIRESRSISFDADVVLFIADNGVRVDKWRNAQRDQLLPLELNGSIQRFENTNQA